MKISSTVLKLHSRHDFILETATYKVQRGITQKVYGSCALHVVRCSLLISCRYFDRFSSYRAETILCRTDKFKGA